MTEKKDKKEKAPAAAKPAEKKPKQDLSGYTPRLKKLYDSNVAALKTELGLKNAMQVPRLVKVVVNIGQGDATQNAKTLDSAVAEVQAITGQKPTKRQAKKSIAGFKLREGLHIGVSVTLRGKRMYEFVDRLVNSALPRVRDFKGISAKAFDGRGNYTLGIKEQIIFPEIDYDKIEKLRGMGITIVTSTKNDAHARALLNSFNFPFRK